MVIYKMTNLINGKYYIGKDARNYPKYLGSGKLLKKAILKYGKENFKKEILFTCQSLIELNEKEIEYVTQEIVDDVNSYNLALGGVLGKNISVYRVPKPFKRTWSERYGEDIANKMKKHHSEVLSGENNGMYNRKHTQEALDKMSKNLKGKNVGKIRSKETKEKIRKHYLGKTFEEIHGIEKAVEIKKNMKKSAANRTRDYIIHIIDNNGKFLYEFKTIQEAVDSLGISRKKAYANSFKEFKIKKIKYD